MSYFGKDVSVGDSPFALLTRSTTGTNAQMDQSTRAWVNTTTRKVNHGKAWIHGFVGTTTTTGWLSGYGLVINALSGRHYYGTGWSDESAARALCDDAFVGWSDDASWSNFSIIIGSASVDTVRTRFNVVRLS